MKKIKAAINPIIGPMSSCDECQISHEETTRTELLNHFKEYPPKEHKETPDDIEWVSVREGEADKMLFRMNIEGTWYEKDSPFGELNASLVIVGKDFYMTRVRTAGHECWEFHRGTLPCRPTKKAPILYLWIPNGITAPEILEKEEELEKVGVFDIENVIEIPDAHCQHIAYKNKKGEEKAIGKNEKRLKIYIAGPYTAPTQWHIEQNVQTAIDVGIVLFKKGHFPFIPHLTHYVDIRAHNTGFPITWEDYMARDLAWLEVADALFFVGESKGADMELEAARARGLEIYYMLSEVPDVCGTLYESEEVTEKK